MTHNNSTMTSVMTFIDKMEMVNYYAQMLLSLLKNGQKVDFFFNMSISMLQHDFITFLLLNTTFWMLFLAIRGCRYNVFHLRANSCPDEIIMHRKCCSPWVISFVYALRTDHSGITCVCDFANLESSCA